MKKFQSLIKLVSFRTAIYKFYNFLFDAFRTPLVELERFELSSKRGTNELSTCLVSTWFSCRGRQETTNRDLIL